mmetsp:Transcript_48286/g.154635  ORF Transcript_48286/g.154635 Transcript_48286/m.154635 type:complete len:130 (+) Transcript_48286:138-527(+)
MSSRVYHGTQRDMMECVGEHVTGIITKSVENMMKNTLVRLNRNLKMGIDKFMRKLPWPINKDKKAPTFSHIVDLLLGEKYVGKRQRIADTYLFLAMFVGACAGIIMWVEVWRYFRPGAGCSPCTPCPAP